VISLSVDVVYVGRANWRAYRSKGW